jgi:hypothetical protein
MTTVVTNIKLKAIFLGSSTYFIQGVESPFTSLEGSHRFKFSSLNANLIINSYSNSDYLLIKISGFYQNALALG